MKTGEPFNPYRKFQVVCIPDPIMEATWLTPIDKLVLGKLLRFAGKNGDCRPSHAALGRGCGLTRRQVQRALGRLLECRLISAKARPGTANRYVFLWHPAYENAPELPAPQLGATPAPHGTRPAPLGGARRDRRESVREQVALPLWKTPKPPERECENCGGTGWRSITTAGMTAVVRCGHG